MKNRDVCKKVPERKEKRRKRGLLWPVVVLTVLLTAGCTGEKASAETELAEGQRKAQIQVMSITGNKLTYLEMEEPETEEETASQEETQAAETEQLTEESTEQESETASPAEESTEQEETEAMSGDFSGGAPSEMPEGMELPEGMEMPEGMELPEGMEPPEGMEASSGDSAEEEAASEEPSSEASGSEKPSSETEGSKQPSGEMEIKTVYLSVGVVVHTPSDTEASFMILEEGDELEVLFEKDENGEEIITEIWML